MPTGMECRCCREITEMMNKISSKGVQCITLHPGFQTVCLDLHTIAYYTGEAPLGGQLPPPSPIQKLVTLYHYMKKRKDTLEHFNLSFCMMYYSLKNQIS